MVYILNCISFDNLDCFIICFVFVYWSVGLNFLRLRQAHVVQAGLKLTRQSRLALNLWQFFCLRFSIAVIINVSSIYNLMPSILYKNLYMYIYRERYAYVCNICDVNIYTPYISIYIIDLQIFQC